MLRKAVACGNTADYKQNIRRFLKRRKPFCFTFLNPEPSAFSSAVEKRKNYNIQDRNFACGSVWV
jgi:hypothetical protein